MRIIIAGSRTINDLSVIEKAVTLSGFEITEVVSGTANGVDKLGEDWANKNNINIKRFPANWLKYGKGAGYRRNFEMAEYAEGLIAVWDGKSKGTKHMIDIAKIKNMKVYIHVQD